MSILVLGSALMAPVGTHFSWARCRDWGGWVGGRPAFSFSRRYHTVLEGVVLLLYNVHSPQQGSETPGVSHPQQHLTLPLLTVATLAGVTLDFWNGPKEAECGDSRLLLLTGHSRALSRP